MKNKKQPSVYLFRILVFFLFPSVSFAGVFKCVNNGVVSFSDQPCLTGAVPYVQHVTVTDSTSNIVTLSRDATGRFSLPGSINGRSTSFLVDTGANKTVISGDFANKLGIHTCVQNGVSKTAGGTTPTCGLNVSSLSFGGFNFSNVSVILSPAMQGDVLLGQDILFGFKVEQHNGVMVLSK
jgi:aspartyl protease family protein